VAVFYKQIGQYPNKIVLVRHYTFGMRSGNHTAQAIANLSKIFRLKGKYFKEARRCLGKSIPSEVLVGVHLRRRDYRTFAGGKFFFSDTDYNAIISHLDKSWNGPVRPRFVLVCEEFVHVRNFGPAKVDYFGPGSIGRDQALLSLCDFILGPPSTFSGWVSFLYDIPRAEIWNPSRYLSWADFNKTSCDYMSISGRDETRGHPDIIA
jgi:hypothetical protein